MELCQEMTLQLRPLSTLQSSATIPLGIWDVTFDLNGVQEQLAVDSARPQVSCMR